MYHNINVFNIMNYFFILYFYTFLCIFLVIYIILLLSDSEIEVERAFGHMQRGG